MKKGSVVRLSIEKMAYKAMGIAHIVEEGPDQGKTVLVAGAVPGEVIDAVITKRKKNYLEGRKVATITANPNQVTAPCPYFGTCGGCKWQHLPYDVQLEYKQGFITDSLERIAKVQIPECHPMIPSSEVLGYRNKIELSFGVVAFESQESFHEKRTKEEHKTEETGNFLGYHGSGSFYKIVDVDACLLQSDYANRVVQVIRTFIKKKGLSAYDPRTHEGFLRHLVLREGKNTGEFMINIITAPTADYTNEFWMPLIDELQLLDNEQQKLESVIWSINDKKADIAQATQMQLLYGREYIVEKIGSLMFKISPFSFFQTNTKGAEKLYDVVKEFAALKGGETVIDLYAGTGTIGMYLADKAKKVFALEENAGSVEDAKVNATMNNIHNVEFHAGKVEKDAFPLVFERPDVVVIDPPRAGMHPRALELLPKFRAQKIIYVSCNPTTLARDIEYLATWYDVKQVQGVDMFPQTYHVETVVELVRK